ncbi:cation diffusion facilitator family transporter [Thermosphaera sp.]
MDGKKEAERKRAGYLEALASVFLNTILFALKYYAALVSSSVALMADAFHTLSDILTSVVVLMGVLLGFKPPDKEHPFGHQRIETIASIVIATMLGIVGYEFFKQSIEKLLHRESLMFSSMALGVMVLSAVLKELLARWAERLGEKHEMSSVKADAWHHRSDAVASLLIIIGLLVGETYWWVDGVLGLIVSGLIVYLAWSLIRTASDRLIGRAPLPVEEEELRKIISSIAPQAKDPHHIHIHEYGAHVEITLHLRLDPKINLEEAHRIATLIEEEVKNKLGWEVTVHLEPDKKVEYKHSTD